MRTSGAAERMDMRANRAFTLIELLVVIGIIALLMALVLPVARLAREHATEAGCRSNLRQMAAILTTYSGSHDNQFPNPYWLYHSPKSFGPDYSATYLAGCRWHDARIGPGSPFLGENKELQGSLVPYLGNPKILRCKTGGRANAQRGCRNRSVIVTASGSTGVVNHRDDIPVLPQYTYTMNSNLCRTIWTGGGSTAEASAAEVNPKTVRVRDVSRNTHVARSPAEVFVFGEENSWTVNAQGLQVNGTLDWAAPYNLSGFWSGADDSFPFESADARYPALTQAGTLYLSALNIKSSYGIRSRAVSGGHARNLEIERVPDAYAGDAFATCHRPRGGDLNTGHSFVALLDGHVEKITVADQLRRSRRVNDLPESRLGPGGNLRLAWPLDVPPLGGWENQ